MTTPREDIVERLDECLHPHDDLPSLPPTPQMVRDALSEIRRLRAENEELVGIFVAGEPRRGVHLRGDGSPCAYLHNGKVCNKCGFVVRAALRRTEAP